MSEARAPTDPRGLTAALDDEAAVLERELGEVELLLRQVRTEAERHETRRQQTAERFESLLATSRASGDVREAHEQLTVQGRRAAMMEAQLEVLEGKQKVLRRFADHVARVRERLAAGGGQAGAATAADMAATEGAAVATSSSVLAAQEEMRRQIARQMHDGPAQSIANIALQAEVVQRLLRQDAAAGERELGALREMVEHALEETKTFIFDVRPMVLDDLGLMPTLRRAAHDRARRSSRRVRFESVGADRRFGAEQESALFRIVDDAVSGYLAGQPAEVSIRLNWTDDDVTATVSNDETSGRVAAEPQAEKLLAPAAVPPALAAMIDAQRDREQARSPYALSPDVLAGIRSRAAAAGIEVVVTPDGRTLSAIYRTG